MTLRQLLSDKLTDPPAEVEDKDAIDVDSRDEEGECALCRAASLGHTECVEVLLDAGATTDLVSGGATTQGMTPLMCGVWSGHAEAIQVLVAHGANIEARWRRTGGQNIIIDRCDVTGATAALLAAMRNHSTCLRRLSSAGAKLDVAGTDDASSGVAHYAARHGHVEVLNLLVELKCDTSTFGRVNGLDKTPLRYAVESGHDRVVICLSALGVSTKEKDAKGFGLCHAAATAGHSSVLAALHSAASGSGDGTTVNCLAEVDARFGWTPAHAAASKGHAACLETLHELGAAETFSVVDRDGFVPAHVAAFNGKADCLRALDTLGAGKTLLAQDTDGWTPAHAAASADHAECLSVMQELGAGVALWMKDKEGRTPADVAREGSHAKCMAVFCKLAPKTKKDHADSNVTDDDGDETEDLEYHDASDSGLLAKLIQGFLVCFVCCGFSCFGGAIALVVFGVLCMTDNATVFLCTADLGADGNEIGGAIGMLIMGGFPLACVGLGRLLLYLETTPCGKPVYIAPDGLAAKRKAAMLKKIGHAELVRTLHDSPLEQSSM